MGESLDLMTLVASDLQKKTGVSNLSVHSLVSISPRILNDLLKTKEFGSDMSSVHQQELSFCQRIVSFSDVQPNLSKVLLSQNNSKQVAYFW